jgi:hypothetical protein
MSEPSDLRGNANPHRWIHPVRHTDEIGGALFFECQIPFNPWFHRFNVRNRSYVFVRKSEPGHLPRFLGIERDGIHLL